MIEKITPRKLNNSKDARIQGALEMYDAYNVSINEFTDPSGDSSFSSNSISGTDTGDAGVIKPAKGNHAATQASLTADKKRRIIGSVSDEVNGVIYCFLRSEDGAEQGVYALVGDTLDPVFTSKIFNFPSNGFVKADIVYAKEGPIIYFTDGVNEPRKLHVSRASEVQGLDLDSADQLRLNDFLVVCPKAPMHRPSFSFKSDPTVATNFAGSQGFQFAFQCIYDTGEETALSPYSNVAVPPSYLNQGSLSEPALNTDNVIRVKIPTSSNGVVNFTENVSKVRLLVRPAGRGAFFEVTELEYDPGVASFYNNNIPFDFSNDTILSGVPQEDVDKLNEAVPKTAKTQAIINDRLMYGNYTEGFDELDSVNCNLDAYYNQRGEEFTNLEIGIKKLILPVGYEVGTKLEYTSELKPSPSGGATDNSGGQLTYNRRTAYQFDLSALPSLIDAGTQLRLRLTIRPDKNFELYDSRNSFHAFKNVGYDAGQNDGDDLSVSGALRKIKKVQDGNDFDADTPAVLQKNKGVLVGDVTWTTVGVDSVIDGLTVGESVQISTGHSPSCPFIIPSTSCTFSIALDFTETISGEATVRNTISRCLKNYFMTGTINDPDGTQVTGVTLVLSESNRQATSVIDQQLSNANNYGVLGAFNADVAETIMQVFKQTDTNSLGIQTNNMPENEPFPVGFMAMNTGELKTSMFYVDGANDAVSGGDNDIGPIFCLEVDDLNGDEYVTMIPKINTSGTLNWYWASKEFFTDVGDANIFLGESIDISGAATDSSGGGLSVTLNSNLYFSLLHPFAANIAYAQSNVSAASLNNSNVFDSINADIDEDFKQSVQWMPNSPTFERLLQIGYVSESPSEARVLKSVSLGNLFGENDGFNLYSIVDGEVNVRRSTVSGPENQNFWYGMLYSSEYLGKQNNMFPLSRGWKGGGGYPGLLHGEFSYGNKSEYSDDNNADGNIDSNLSATALDAILDESYPEAEILNFASAVYNSSISLDPQSRSFKRYCSHDFGVVFFDERGRPGNVNPLGSVYVGGFAESQNTGSAFVTAKFTQTVSNIPSWAHYYRMVYGGNSTIDDFVQYSAGGAFVAADSGGTDGLIYVSLNHLQENGDVSYTKAFGAVKEDGDKDMYTFSAGDKLRIISYFEGEETSTRKFVNEADHRFDVVGTVTLGKEDNPLVGENEDVHPAKMGQFVILKNNFRATGFSFADISQGRQIGAGTNTSDIYDQGTNFWNKRCVFEIYSPAKTQEAEDRIYYEIGKTYNIIKESGQRKYQTPLVVLTEGDVFFRKSAVNMQPFDGSEFLGLIGNGNGTFEERSEPNFESYYLESKTFTDNFPGADVKPFGKPRIVSREKEEVVSPFSIKFSDKTNPTSNTLRYSSFNNSKFPYKDLQSSDGPISYMLNLNDNLLCIQQLKCSSIPVARTVLADALGNETVVTSSKVLGTERYYAGMYGTSHPESVVNVDNFVYFASSDRREVYRFDGSQGIEVISGKGMGGFFDRTLFLDKDKENRVVGGYDPDTDEFVLSVNKDISEFSVSNFINPPAQAAGSIIVDDAVEGFVGITDTIGGGFAGSDEFVDAIVFSLSNINGLIQQEQEMFANILQQAADIQTLLSGNFEPQFTGQSIDIVVGNNTYTIGPFSNATSYNAELLELQSSVFETLNTAVGALIGRYKELDNLYSNISTVVLGTTGRIQDQLELLTNVVSQAPQILGAGVLDEIFPVSNQPYDLALLNQYLAQANEARGQAAEVRNAYEASSPIIVDAQYVINEVYQLGGVEIPSDILTAQTEEIRYLNDFEGVTIGEAIGFVFTNYTNLTEVVGNIETSDLVSSVLGQIIAGIGDENELINNLLFDLYGSDLQPGGGDGGYIELYQDTLANYNDLLTVAYGDDQTPISDGGNGLDGLEGQVKDLESLIDGFVEYQDNIFNAAGQLAANILGTQASNGEWEYSFNLLDADGNEYTKTKTFTVTDVGSNYGFNDAGYAELVNLISAGQLDVSELTDQITALNLEISNRTSVMDQVIDDYIGYSLAPHNDSFRTDTDGSYTAGVIAGIIAVLNNRIPDQGLLTSMYERLFNYVNAQGNIVDQPLQDNPLGVDFDVSVEASAGGTLNVLNADPADAAGNIEALFLAALDKALENILDTVMGGVNNDGVIQSAYSLAQWYSAWNNIANNNSDVIDSVADYTAQQIDVFSSQTIEPIVIDNQTGDIQSFAQLVAFLGQTPLDKNQIKDLIYGLVNSNEAQNNILAAADFDNNGSVGTSDLIVFLGTFGVTPADPLVGFGGAPLGSIGQFPE